MTETQHATTGAAPLDVESVVLRLIAEAGEARGLVYEALEYSLADEFARARETLARADEHVRAAHAIQFSELIAPEAEGQHVPISLLVIHAMDLMMTTASERDLANLLITSGLAASAAGRKANGATS